MKKIKLILVGILTITSLGAWDDNHVAFHIGFISISPAIDVVVSDNVVVTGLYIPTTYGSQYSIGARIFESQAMRGYYIGGAYSYLDITSESTKLSASTQSAFVGWMDSWGALLYGQELKIDFPTVTYQDSSVSIPFLWHVDILRVGLVF